jgi:hypothetical protein
MEYAAILNIGMRSNTDGVNVTAQDGIHPHGRMLAQHHIANNLRGIVHVTTGRNGWR